MNEWHKKIGLKRKGRMGEKDAEKSALANALQERKSDTEPAGPGVADQSVQTKICPRWRGAWIPLVDPIVWAGWAGRVRFRQFAGCACLESQAVKGRMEGPGSRAVFRRDPSSINP
jgi:hypothetical protein